MCYKKIFNKGNYNETLAYFKDKQCTILHREDGPAAENVNGTKKWFINGEFHREDGPAVEWDDGEKWWYKNGKRHREDGPAITYRDDSDEIYFLNGKEYSKEEYWVIIKFGDFV